MKSSSFRALPTELMQLIAQYTPHPRKLARTMRFSLPKTSVPTDQIWKLFFSSYAWLDDAKSSGQPPILVGEVLRTLRGTGVEDWQVGHVCLVYEGPMDMDTFKRCLHPHVRHTHGRSITWDYAFPTHGITLNYACAYKPNLSHPINSKWPDRLSQPTSKGRQAAYLVYGEKELGEAKVIGLGKNLQSPESVSRVCGFQLHNNKTFFVCSEDFALFKLDDSSSFPVYADDSSSFPVDAEDSSPFLVYADDYGKKYKEILEKLIERDDSDPSKIKCKACEMEDNETFDCF